MKEQLRIRAKELLAQAEVRWQALAPREKKIVMVGVVFLAFFIVYTLLWLPLNNHVLFLRESIQKNQKLLVWMQAADKQMRTLTPNQQQVTTMSTTALLGWLQKSIQAAELSQYLAQLKGGPNDAIDIQFQEIDFDRFIAWLMKAQAQQHFAILRMSISKGRTAGLVQIQLTVRAGA